MQVIRRTIPSLPERPRLPWIVSSLRRSYPVGRQEFSRATVGLPLKLSFSTEQPLPPGIQACLDTTLNAGSAAEWTAVPFKRTDERTLTCRITPAVPGLFTFRARCSMDGGNTWIKNRFCASRRISRASGCHRDIHPHPMAVRTDPSHSDFAGLRGKSFPVRSNRTVQS